MRNFLSQITKEMESDFVDNQLNGLFIIENEQIFEFSDSFIEFTEDEILK